MGQHVLCPGEEHMCSVAVGCTVLQMSVRFIWSILQFRSAGFCFVFLDSLTIAKSSCTIV